MWLPAALLSPESLLVAACLCCSAAAVAAQRPTNPALMEPQKAPELDYVAVADPLPLPAGMNDGRFRQRRVRLQRPSLRSEPRSLSRCSSSMRTESSFAPSAKGCSGARHGLRIDQRRQHLGDRRRRAHRGEAESAGADSADHRHQRRRRASGTKPRSRTT